MDKVGRASPWFASLLAAAIMFTAAITADRAAAQTEEFYKLQAGDVVEVAVLEDPDLGRQVLVRPDGRISMPLVGTLMAAGRSPEELQAAIRSRLARNFVEAPTVNVALISSSTGNLEEIEEIELYSVYILGEVARPGRYEYPSEEAITVLQALTLAGGTGPFAAVERIQIREVVDSVESVRLFNYDRVQDGEQLDTTHFEPLADGAVLVVPERGFLE